MTRIAMHPKPESHASDPISPNRTRGRFRLPFALVLLGSLVGLLGCEGAGTRRDTRQPEAAHLGGSPLGPAFPNPLLVLHNIRTAMEDGDWDEACLHLAGLGRTGLPVPLVPGENVEQVPASQLDQMGPYLAMLEALERPWVNVSYGSPRSLKNTPPFFAVPMTFTYDYGRIPAEERRVMLDRWAAERTRPGTWEEFVVAMRESEVRAHGTKEMAFAYLRDRWRLYLGAIPQS